MTTELLGGQADLLEGTSLLNERYQIIRTLGKGGFGITYMARDTVLYRNVAIKEFFPSGIAQRDANTNQNVWCTQDAVQTLEYGKKRFLNEAQILAKLDYSHIVKVYDCFESNRTAYIVMEYVAGETLAQYVEKNGVMTDKHLLKLLLPLMQELNEIHKRGLLHRDISPDNIMVTTQNGQLKLVLIDFGTAKDLSPADGKSKSYSMSHVVVKMNYSPIEMFSSTKKQPSADVYSLCATMYFCLTGDAPPSSLDRAFHDTLKLPTGLTADRNLKYAVLKGLSLKPEDRYASVEALQKELEGGKAVGLKSGWLLAGCAALLALVICTVVWIIKIDTSKTGNSAPPAETEVDSVSVPPISEDILIDPIPDETVIEQLTKELVESYPNVSIKGDPENLENITIDLGMEVDETLSSASLLAAEQIYALLNDNSVHSATVHFIDEKEDELCRVSFKSTEKDASELGLGVFKFDGGRLEKYTLDFQRLYDANPFIRRVPKAASTGSAEPEPEPEPEAEPTPAPEADEPKSAQTLYTLTSDEAGYYVMQGTEYQIYCPFPGEYEVDTEASGETLLMRAVSTVNRNFIEIHGKTIEKSMTAEEALLEAEKELGGHVNFEMHGNSWFACSVDEGGIGIYRKGKLRADGTVIVWFDYHVLDNDETHSEYIEYMEDAFTSNLQ